MIVAEEDNLAQLNEEANLLTDKIEETDSNMADLDVELANLKQNRERQLKHNEQLAAQDRAEYEAKLRQRNTYVAIPGDTLDEMMAQHLDGTPYAPSMTALGDGNY